ncbi:hypothetical protein SCHPADRAFT_483398 [Schizopora paradoxa]|uniref:Uncharacterized protein n=1 Tax=Schizopora paradoxa TaxID=27342 RepID=A0A0H2RH26_9AGAM|nr:hypothetical protein SCHPADRAFT_483398 [Schizopora paradoxa]
MHSRCASNWRGRRGEDVCGRSLPVVRVYFVVNEMVVRWKESRNASWQSIAPCSRRGCRSTLWPVTKTMSSKCGRCGLSVLCATATLFPSTTMSSNNDKPVFRLFAAHNRSSRWSMLTKIRKKERIVGRSNSHPVTLSGGCLDSFRCF